MCDDPSLFIRKVKFRCWARRWHICWWVNSVQAVHSRLFRSRVSFCAALLYFFYRNRIAARVDLLKWRRNKCAISSAWNTLVNDIEGTRQRVNACVTRRQNLVWHPRISRTFDVSSAQLIDRNKRRKNIKTKQMSDVLSIKVRAKRFTRCPF